MRRTPYGADHEAFRGVVRTFISKEIVPRDAEWSAAGIVARELFTAAAAQGLIGWATPEQLGGGGQPEFRFTTVFIEELAAAGVAGSGNGLTLTNEVTCLTSST